MPLAVDDWTTPPIAGIKAKRTRLYAPKHAEGPGFFHECGRAFAFVAAAKQDNEEGRGDPTLTARAANQDDRLKKRRTILRVLRVNPQKDADSDPRQQLRDSLGADQSPGARLVLHDDAFRPQLTGLEMRLWSRTRPAAWPLKQSYPPDSWS